MPRDQLVRLPADRRKIDVAKLVSEDVEAIELSSTVIEKQLVRIGVVRRGGGVGLHGIACGIHLVESAGSWLPSGANAHEQDIIAIRLLLGVDCNLSRLCGELPIPAETAR